MKNDAGYRPIFPLPAPLLRAIYDATIAKVPAWDTSKLRDWYLDTNPAAPVPPAERKKLNGAFGFEMEGAWKTGVVGYREFEIAEKATAADQLVLEAVLFRLQCNFSPYWSCERRIFMFESFLRQITYNSAKASPWSSARYLILWVFVEALHRNFHLGLSTQFNLHQAFPVVARLAGLAFWSPASQCFVTLGTTLQFAKDVQLVVKNMCLFRLFEDAHSEKEFRPLLCTSGGRFLLRSATLFVDRRLNVRALCCILHLMPMLQWISEEPRLLDVWKEVSSRVPRRGWSRQKPKSASLSAICVDADFIWYRLLRHHIAVDRAILRHYFRCSKSSLGRVNHDVISDVELFIYGRHTWPRWFLRDFYRNTAK